jgi:hypothetical protein
MDAPASASSPVEFLLRRSTPRLPLAASFRDLDAELAVVLDVLPAASLRLSPDAAGHLDLLRAHCRRRAPAQYHDRDEAARSTTWRPPSPRLISL